MRKSGPVIAVAACLSGLSLAALAQTVVDYSSTVEPSAPVRESDLGYLRATRANVQVTVRDRGSRFRAYTRHPLVGETSTHYFVPDNWGNACAIPKQDKKGEATAWVGEAGIVFFAVAVAGEEAVLPVREGTEWPVLEKRALGFVVLIGPDKKHSAKLELNELPTGLVLYERTLLDEYRKKAQRRTGRRKPDRVRRSTEAAGLPSSGAGDPGTGPETGGQTTGRRTGRGDTPYAVPVRRGSSAQPTSVVEQPEEPAPDPEKPRFRLPKINIKWTPELKRILIWVACGVLAVIVVVLFVVVVVRVLRARKAHRLAAEPTDRMEPVKQGAESELLEKIASDKMLGALATLTIVDLIQFLNLSGQSGLLMVGDENDPVATLTLKQGEIVSANCRGVKGDEAVFAVLREKTGMFVFSKGTFRAEEGAEVRAKTASLLMEGVRRIDEPPPEAAAPKKRTFRLVRRLKKG